MPGNGLQVWESSQFYPEPAATCRPILGPTRCGATGLDVEGVQRSRSSCQRFNLS